MLKALHADGYRLLDEFDADFGKLTVVVGANACGKSTVLDCLSFVTQTASGFPTPVGMHGGLPSLLSAGGQRGRLIVEARLDHSGGFPWSSIPTDGILHYLLKLSAGPGGRPELDGEFLLELDGPNPQGPIYLENSPRGFFVYDHDKKELLPFDQPPENPVASKRPSSGQVAVNQEVPPEPVFRLAQMQYLQKYPVLSSVRNSLCWFSFYSGFDVSAASPVRTQLSEIRPETLLYPNAQNLGAILHELLTRYEYRSVAQEIKDCLKTAYPHFEEISAETAYSGTPPRVLLRIAEKGLKRPVEIWELSDGMLRFLCLAVALLSPIPRSFVAFDEPETGLHPKLLPIVGDMIKSAAERTQVLITTHSPDLLNSFSLDDIVVMRRDESRAKWDRPGTHKALQKMLDSTLGGTVGDLHRSGELEGITK